MLSLYASRQLRRSVVVGHLYCFGDVDIDRGDVAFGGRSSYRRRVGGKVGVKSEHGWRNTASR